MRPLLHPSVRRCAARRLGGVVPVLLPILGLLLTALVPAIALADDAPLPPDGRLEGYATSVSLPDPSGNGSSWFFLILLGLVAVAVLFKNAKRSHLD